MPVNAWSMWTSLRLPNQAYTKHESAWQGYIRSSGLRALTRSATEPSAITGGETVEQLEVRPPGNVCQCKGVCLNLHVRLLNGVHGHYWRRLK